MKAVILNFGKVYGYMDWQVKVSRAKNVESSYIAIVTYHSKNIIAFIKVVFNELNINILNIKHIVMKFYELQCCQR